MVLLCIFVVFYFVFLWYFTLCVPTPKRYRGNLLGVEVDNKEIVGGVVGDAEDAGVQGLVVAPNLLHHRLDIMVPKIRAVG